MAAHQASHRTTPDPDRPTPPGQARYPFAGKAAAYQARGAVQLHVLLRLGGLARPTPAACCLPRRASPPPTSKTPPATPPPPSLPHRPAPGQPARLAHRLGRQLDVRIITMTGTGTITDLAVASYLAKYATKGTEITGHASARITPDTIDLYANPAGTHPERLIAACWRLGRHPDHTSLRRWAHMLGFGATSSPKPAATPSGSATCARHASSTAAATTPDPNTDPSTPPTRPTTKPPSSSAPSPTPEPAGTPPEMPSSPTPPPTKPGNAAKPDTTNSPTNTTASSAMARQRKCSSHPLTIKSQSQYSYAYRGRNRGT